MTTTPNYSVLKSPIDLGIKTMLQHQTYILLNGLILSAIKTIELAVQCDDPRLKYIAQDSYENYTVARQLINYFTLAGIDPIPDQTWADPEGMKENFNVSYEEMLLRLNDQTIDTIVSRGMNII